MSTPKNFKKNNTIHDPTKILLAIISTFLSVWAISLHWLYVSEFVKRHPGTTLVLIGVLGEGVELGLKFWRKQLYEKYEHKIEMFGFVFWAIVVIGLAWEIPEAAKTDREAQSFRLSSAETLNPIHKKHLGFDSLTLQSIL
jgi:hypothetical protein